MPADAAMMIVACADDAEADRISALLVENRHAACVQALPVRSTYRWRGAVERAQEVLLLVKTTVAAAAGAAEAIRGAHSYAVPEILVFRAESGLADYLAWLEGQVANSGTAD